jgi:hypothetical protein
MTAGAVHLSQTAEQRHSSLFSALNLIHSFTNEVSKARRQRWHSERIVCCPARIRTRILLVWPIRNELKWLWKFPLMIAAVQFFEYQTTVARSQLMLSPFFSLNKDITYDITAHYFLFNEIGWRWYQSVIGAGRFSNYGARNIHKFRILSTQCLFVWCMYWCIRVYLRVCLLRRCATVRRSCTFMSVTC